jgi:hypothetical protein
MRWEKTYTTKSYTAVYLLDIFNTEPIFYRKLQIHHFVHKLYIFSSNLVSRHNKMGLVVLLTSIKKNNKIADTELHKNQEGVPSYTKPKNKPSALT